ncbi:zinc finger, CCHC-type containing LTR copia-type gag-polypeptide [Tanacetum coccineum]
MDSSVTQHDSLERTHTLRDSLRRLKKGTSIVSECSRRFKIICEQLQAIGHPLPHDDKSHWFLCGVGSSFKTFSTTQRLITTRPNFRDLVSQGNRRPNLLYKGQTTRGIEVLRKQLAKFIPGIWKRANVIMDKDCNTKGGNVRDFGGFPEYKLKQFRSAKCASNDDVKRPLNSITVSPSSDGTVRIHFIIQFYHHRVFYKICFIPRQIHGIAVLNMFNGYILKFEYIDESDEEDNEAECKDVLTDSPMNFRLDSLNARIHMVVSEVGLEQKAASTAIKANLAASIAAIEARSAIAIAAAHIGMLWFAYITMASALNVVQTNHSFVDYALLGCLSRM